MGVREEEGKGLRWYGEKKDGRASLEEGREKSGMQGGWMEISER